MEKKYDVARDRTNDHLLSNLNFKKRGESGKLSCHHSLPRLCSRGKSYFATEVRCVICSSVCMVELRSHWMIVGYYLHMASDLSCVTLTSWKFLDTLGPTNLRHQWWSLTPNDWLWRRLQPSEVLHYELRPPSRGIKTLTSIYPSVAFRFAYYSITGALSYQEASDQSNRRRRSEIIQSLKDVRCYRKQDLELLFSP